MSLTEPQFFRPLHVPLRVRYERTVEEILPLPPTREGRLTSRNEASAELARFDRTTGSH